MLKNLVVPIKNCILVLSKMWHISYICQISYIILYTCISMRPWPITSKLTLTKLTYRYKCTSKHVQPMFSFWKVTVLTWCANTCQNLFTTIVYAWWFHKCTQSNLCQSTYTTQICISAKLGQINEFNWVFSEYDKIIRRFYSNYWPGRHTN